MQLTMDKPLSDTDFSFNLKLNPEVKEKWVSALNSGAFPQTTGALKQVKPVITAPNGAGNTEQVVGYCCLGVLCEVAVLNNVIPAGVQPHTTEKWVEATYDADTHELIDGGHWEQLPLDQQIPKGFWNFDNGSDMPGFTVLEWADLPIEVAKYLAHKNDNGATFGQIADFIQREL